MNSYCIGIVGGGRLGSALARAFVRRGWPHSQLLILQRNPEKGAALEREGFWVEAELPRGTALDLAFLTVMRHDLPAALASLYRHVIPGPAIISAVTGVSATALAAHVPVGTAIFRAKYSVFVEVQQSLVPLSVCNDAADAVYAEVAPILSTLGELQVVSEQLMDLAGWELSSVPGMVLGQVLLQRLQEVGSEHEEWTAELLLCGMDSLISYLQQSHEQGQSLVGAIKALQERIATPNGVNESMMLYLQDQGVWLAISAAAERFRNHIAPSDPSTDCSASHDSVKQTQ